VVPRVTQLNKPLPISLDVTSLVTKAINANGIASFQLDVISAPTRLASVGIVTRESFVAANRPALTVTLNQAPTIANAATAAPNPCRDVDRAFGTGRR